MFRAAGLTSAANSLSPPRQGSSPSPRGTARADNRNGGARVRRPRSLP